MVLSGISLTRLFTRISSPRYFCIRNFLSESYLCRDVWKQRLKEPLIEKFNSSSYYYQLDQKFLTEKRISAVDIDIFAHGITDQESLNDLEELVYRFRRTPDAANAFESTSHAVIRTFLEFEVTDPLMRILNDRVNYGIFHDYYTANLMMDYFIKRENYRDAAKVATLLMLQEDFDHPISNHLALYSCHMYLQQTQPEPWDPEAEEESKKVDGGDEDEEILMRVRFIDQPYFDDHFDLREPKHLIGKTLALLGKRSNSTVGLTSQLMGWVLFEKLDKAKALLESLTKDNKQALFKEGVEKVQKYLKEISSKENDCSEIESFIEKLSKNEQIIEGDMLKLISEDINNAIQTLATEDVIQIQNLYVKWAENRKNAVDKQVATYLRQQKIQEIIKKKLTLKEKEELLFFFENLEKHRMNIPPKEEDEMINEEGKISGKSLLHVPPEIEGKTGRYSLGIIREHDPWWKWEETKEEEVKDFLETPDFVKEVTRPKVYKK